MEENNNDKETFRDLTEEQLADVKERMDSLAKLFYELWLRKIKEDAGL